MAANKILKSMPFTNIIKEGKQVALAVAIETTKWTRTEAMALQQGPAVEKALVKDEKPLPAGTAEVVVRENQHSSPNDRRVHYTMCCYDAKGNFIGSIHVPVE